jgi:hypothetical protein
VSQDFLLECLSDDCPRQGAFMKICGCLTHRTVVAMLQLGALTVIVLCVSATAAHAQGSGPGFHVSAGGDLNCPGAQTLSLPSPPASLGPIAFPCTSGQGIAAAEADATTLRAFGRSEHTCCGTASGGNGSARIQIENVVITGPAAASIPVSLNFSLRGTLTRNTSFSGNGVFLFVRLAGVNTNLSSTSQIAANDAGIYDQTGVFAPLTIGFPNGAIDQAFVTPVANAAPNQPLMFEIQLRATTGTAGDGFAESDFFSGTNGFFLPIGIPVFNLPPGYTITIPELNVFDNYVALPALFSGDIFVVGTNASEISLPGVTQLTGSISIDDNTSATGIDLSTLDSVGGSVSINDNTSATGIDLSTLDSVGGSVSIDGNTSATGINLSDLDSAGGSISIDGNTSAVGIDLSMLDIAGGSIGIDGNTSATGINLSDLDSAGGSISIDGNTSAAGIDLASLTIVGGPLTVANNGPCPAVTIGALTTVTGDLTVESCGTGTFTPGPVAAGGKETLTTAGYTTVTGTTSTGSTTVTTGTSDAFMTVALPAGTFTTPVSFTITELDPNTLTPQDGVGPSGEPATIDPIAAYQITFGVPTLNADATLTFDVYVAGVDPDTSAAFFDALAAGRVTLATQGDAGGSYQAFPICATGQTPTEGGCVLVELLDANGQPTTDTPAIVRFSNVVGHFSRWAVAIVTPHPPASNAFHGLLAPYPAPPHTTTPTFKRGSVVPLKFGWVDAAGLVVDSALAAPVVAVYGTSCTSEAPTTTPITPDDAGASGGLRYDAGTLTWIFNWSTKGLAAVCFAIHVTPANTQFGAPSQLFPIALRDR